MDRFVGSGFSKSGTVNGLFGYGSPLLDAVNQASFAILDFETSGTSPANGRVIEVAILTMDTKGSILEEYSTLINPEDGKAGLSMIHHIVPRMLEDAPTFQEVAQDIVSRLTGRIVVSHNAAFEEKFLSAEIKQARAHLPLLPAVDTLQFLPRVLDLPDYKQTTIMRHMEIQTDEHTALGDTRGLAEVLRNFLPEVLSLGYPVALSPEVPADTTGRVYQRVTNLRKGGSGWMANLLPKLPVTSFAMGSFDRYQYWGLLLEVLEDGKITGDEIKQLAIEIGRSGLSQDDVRQLNQDFLDQQFELALADGVVTPEEQEYLNKISLALGTS